MGKISDALKKIEKRREEQRQAQNSNPAEENMIEAPDELRGDAFLNPSGKNVFNMEGVISAHAAADGTGIDRRVVTYFDYSSPVAEQYRVLRTHIKSHLSKKKNQGGSLLEKTQSGSKVITITSALAGEGKSVTSVNLAVAMAHDLDSKVLIVDCDLRNGITHRLLNMESGPGLTEVLSKGIHYSEAVRATAVKNLFIIPRGKLPSNPSELLGSQRMRALIEQLKTEPLTYVIIDTPPLCPFTDAVVLGAYTHGVVMVVQAHRTQEKVVKKAKELLEKAQVNLLGFVLTQSDYYIPDIYGYYYYRYFNKSGNSKGKKPAAAGIK